MSKYLATFGKPRFLGIVELDPKIAGALSNDGKLIASSHRGDEVASVMGPLNEAQEQEYRNMKSVSEHGEGPARGGEPIVSDLEFIRVPACEDLKQWASSKESEESILKEAQDMVERHHIELKLIDVETMIDGKKLFLYFTSETRVDFRVLVKDLARKFRTRIELRQMGVRDEARLVSGMASCGLPCCCSYWLNQFAPIGIKMVKEQNIALNPAKISGICGRLMCCMAFEHKVYKNLWAGLPGPGSKIKTPNGNYVIAAMDISRESVRCHKPAGGDLSVPIAMFQDFRNAVTKGEEWESPHSAEETERASAVRGKYEFSCRRNIEFRGAVPIAPESMETADLEESAVKGNVKTVMPDEGKSNENPSSEGHSERRRNRRGGRKRRPCGEAPRADAQQPKEKPPAKAPDEFQIEAQSQAKAARNRRKRRRPRHGQAPHATEN